MYKNLFNQQGLSIERLRALVEVCSAGSISKAVGGDSVRQSLYSRQLKELEEYFGVELTRRKGRGLVITEKGQRLAQIAREQFQGLSDFKQDCEHKNLHFNFGAGDSLLHWLLIPELGNIQNEALHTVFSLHNLRSSQIIERLNTLELDFGLVRPEKVVRPIKSKILGALHYSLFIPRKLVASDDKNSAFLENLPIATQANDSAFKDALLASAHKHNCNLNLRLHCESFPEARQALFSGKYAAILPNIAADDLQDNVYLKTTPVFLRALTRKVALVWNPRMIRLRMGVEPLLNSIEKKLRKRLSV